MTSRGWVTIFAAMTALVLAGGCGSTPPPAPAAPTEAAPAPTPVYEPAPVEEPEREARAEPARPPEPAGAPPTDPGYTELFGDEQPTDDGMTVVIDPGGEAAGNDRDLVAAASAERRRRDTSEGSVAVIDDRTLSDYSGVELTEAEVTGRAEVDPETLETLAELERGEEYWTAQVLDARRTWRSAYDSIERLEARAAEARRRFYAEDDPFYRDSQIKPQWDRALEELDRARDEMVEARRRLARLLVEGRESGALPGWLREGIELEPEPLFPDDAALVRDDGEELDIYEPGEPVISRDDGDDGGGVRP